jgi:choline dehydrogenase-like flavoprotein
MADAVSTQVLKDHASAWAVKLTNISDGTGETNVVKVSANSLIASNGDGSTQRLSITKLFWNVSANRVNLLWRGTTNTLITTLTGTGSWNLVGEGSMPLTNNAGAGANGDILLTTSGFVNGSAYTIIMEGKKLSGYTSRETTDDGISP